ncbi:MAG: hypothetical protein ACK49X_04565 [Akkermansiaceae bacterium]
MKLTNLSIAVIAMLSLHACKPKESASDAETQAPDPVLAAYFVTETLPDAQSIHIARTTAKPGDAITLKGEVIGREKVFVDGRAAFILGDPEKLTSCDKNPGDACETPWDACCDSKEVKKIAIASIQILGEDGRVMARELKGVNNLKELSSITVSGVVDQSSKEDNFVINAKQIQGEKTCGI